jgi:hypothetical protein
MDHPEPSSLVAALKAVASAFIADGVPFALAGGYAVYARGGHEKYHDVDFAVPREAMPVAVGALERRGHQVVQPPEDWLAKVEVEGHCVDLIHRLSGLDVDDALLGRAQVLPVASISMPVMSASDLVISKLHALTEHHCDLEPVLSVLRSVREQVDLERVERECRGHPFAEACLYLAGRLGLLTPLRAATAGAGHGGGGTGALHSVETRGAHP